MCDLNLIIDGLKTKQHDLGNEINIYQAELEILAQKIGEINELLADKVNIKQQCDIALKNAIEQLNNYNSVVEVSQSFLQSHTSPTSASTAASSLIDANNYNNSLTVTTNNGKHRILTIIFYYSTLLSVTWLTIDLSDAGIDLGEPIDDSQDTPTDDHSSYVVPEQGLFDEFTYL